MHLTKRIIIKAIASIRDDKPFQSSLGLESDYIDFAHNLHFALALKRVCEMYGIESNVVGVCGTPKSNFVGVFGSSEFKCFHYVLNAFGGYFDINATGRRSVLIGWKRIIDIKLIRRPVIWLNPEDRDIIAKLVERMIELVDGEMHV